MSERYREPPDQPTERGVLKGEGHNILYPFGGHYQRIGTKAFAEDNLDPTNIIAGAPSLLRQHLAPEMGKPK